MDSKLPRSSEEILADDIRDAVRDVVHLTAVGELEREGSSVRVGRGDASHLGHVDAIHVLHADGDHHVAGLSRPNGGLQVCQPSLA